MQYIDVKYINICGSQLRNFKRKGPSLYNCSCPVCGDSEKKLNKARGYFIGKGNKFWFHCHNCQINLSLNNFLKRLFPLQYQEYVLEKYKDKEAETVVITTTKPIVLKKMSVSNAINIDSLPNNHYAKEYIKARMIPEDKLALLYYTDDFAKLTEELFPEQYTNLAPNDTRIVIPFFDRQGNVVGLQGRSLDSSNSLRYITVRANKEVALIYGLDRIDLTKQVIVVEGPLDSLFLPNALAVASSDLLRSIRVVPNIKDFILVFDNEPRNREIVRLVEDAVECGTNVCLWPTDIEEKDINDMVRSGIRKEKILDIIKTNTFAGLRAKMKLVEWRKCQ